MARRLVDSKNMTPGIKVEIFQWDSPWEEGIVPIFYGKYFRPVRLGELRGTDGILTITFDDTTDGSFQNRRECPNELRQWMESLENVRKNTSKRLDEWYKYIKWEIEETKKEEWGAIVKDTIPPGSKEINHRYGIRIHKTMWKILLSSRGNRLYASHMSNSSNPDIWKRKKEDENGNNNIRGQEKGQEFEIGKLEKIRRKRKKSGKAFLDIILEVSPPDPENPEEVKYVEPEEYFIVNDIAISQAQFKRQWKAIDRLRDQEAWYNNLHDWIFDISQASPNPQVPPELKYSLLSNTKLNENQELAVRRALSAQDVCLIQGPPGTGKTTVIAEIINQATQDNRKILLASQTNLAVDNALGRLGMVPNVRPIRRHSKSATADPEAEKFIENNVVKDFFIPSIKKHCSRQQEKDEKLLQYWNIIKMAKNELPNLVEQYIKFEDIVQDSYNRVNELLARMNVLEDKKIDAENEKHVLRRNESAMIKGDLLTLPSKIREALKISNDLIGKIDQDRLQKTAFPILGDLQSLLENDEMLSGEQSEETISLVKERGNIDKTSTDRKIILRLLEINERLEELDNQSKEESWPKWSGKVNRGLVKLRDVYNDHLLELPPALDILNKAVCSTHPPEDLDKKRIQVGKWVERTLEEIIGLQGALHDEIISSLESLTNRCRDRLKSLEKDIKILNKEISILRKEVSELNESIEYNRKRMNTINNKWKKVTLSLPFELLQNITDIPNSDIFDLIDDLKGWEKDNANRIQEANRWANLRREWLFNLENPDREVLRDLNDMYMELVNIEGVTTSFSGSWHWYNKYVGDPFDIVIIDEVSKATPPELLQSLLLGKTAVLVGDHKQLPPTFRHHAPSVSLGVTDEMSAVEQDDPERLKKFERMVTSSLFKELFIDAHDSIKQPLTIQYRMHRDIMRCINQFYNFGLESGIPEKEEIMKKAHGLRIKQKDDWDVFRKGSDIITPDKHVVWVDSSFDRNNTYHPDVQWGGGSSKANEREVLIAQQVLNQIDELVCMEKEKNAEDEWGSHPMLQHLEGDRLPLGFITFYGGQVAQFKKTVLKGQPWPYMNGIWSNLSVKVNTVDRFQGGERPVVLVSTVVSQNIPDKAKIDFKRATKEYNPDTFRQSKPSLGGIPWPSTGFVKAYERINVALSRAQNLLIIIGNRWGFEKVNIQIQDDLKKRKYKRRVYKKILQEIDKRGGNINGATLI